MARSETARFPFTVTTIGCCLLAAALRLWHIGHGLPDLDEEAFPFRRALALWGVGGASSDLNPHWFAYPSLTIYLQFLVQHLYFVARRFDSHADFLLAVASDPSGAVILGRLVGVIADVATVALVGRVARRFGAWPSILAMILVALAPTMIQTSRLLYADSIACALSIAAIERLLAYRDAGGGARLAAAAALIGLAAGTKYPAAMILVPLALAVWRRERGPRAMISLIVATGIAGAAFVCTTPYLLVSGSEFLRDAVFIGDATSRGQLGKLGGTTFSYYLLGLGRNLGWIGLGLLAASGVAAASGSARGARLLWASWLVLFLPIAVVPVEADRYLVPTIAVSACLVAAGATRLTRLLRTPRQSWPLGSLIVVALLQPAWSGAATARAGRSTTQSEARKWCEAHLEDHDVLLSEAYGPNLLTYRHWSEVMASPVFQQAGPAAQAAYRSLRAYHMVWLPLIVGGYASIRLPTSGSPDVAVYPHAVDWNAAVYDIRLLNGVDYVATTSVVRGRFSKDAERFPEQRRFYAWLDRLAQRVAEFDSDAEVEGPTIGIYRLTARAHESVSRAERLDTLWWARTVPETFKTEVERALAGAAQGEPIPGLATWEVALRSAYADRYAPFADDLALNLAMVGRLEAAEGLAMAGLRILPDDMVAARIYAGAAGRLGKSADVARMLARSKAFMQGTRRSGSQGP